MPRDGTLPAVLQAAPLSILPAPAANSIWTGAGDTASWWDPANWNGAVPQDGVNAVFAGGNANVSLADDGGAQPVTSALNVTAGQVTLSGGRLGLMADDPASGRNPLSIAAGAQLTIAADAQVYDRHVFAYVGQLGGGSLTVNGSLKLYTTLDVGGSSVTVAGETARLVGQTGTTLRIGMNGQGQVTVQDGARVVEDQVYVGTSDTRVGGQMTISGAGTVAKISSVVTGGYAAAGAGLQILDGAYAAIDDVELTAGDGEPTNRVLVSGDGAVLKVTDALMILGSRNTLELRDHARLVLDITMDVFGGTFAFDGAKVSGSGLIHLSDGTIDALTPDDPAAPPPTLWQSIMITNHGHFVSDAGTRLVLAGEIDGVGGELDVDGGTVELRGYNAKGAHHNDFQNAVINSGTLDVNGGEGTAGTGNVRFADNAQGTLALHASFFQRMDTPMFSNMVASFQAGDAIDVTDIGFGLDTVVTFGPWLYGDGILTVSNGSTSLSVILEGRHDPAGFHAASDGQGGTLVSYSGAFSSTGGVVGDDFPTRTWTGAGATAAWFDAGNWTADAPTNGTDALFTTNATVLLDPQDYAAPGVSRMRITGAQVTLQHGRLTVHGNDPLHRSSSLLVNNGGTLTIAPDAWLVAGTNDAGTDIGAGSALNLAGRATMPRLSVAAGGTVSVAGQDASLSSAYSIQVEGQFRAAQGAHVDAEWLNIVGSSAGSQGTLLAEGRGTSLHADGLVVGGDGVGKVLISHGAQLTADALVYSRNFGARGSSVTVSGWHSSLLVQQALQLGTAQSQRLKLANHANLSAPCGINIAGGLYWDGTATIDTPVDRPITLAGGTFALIHPDWLPPDTNSAAVSYGFTLAPDANGLASGTFKAAAGSALVLNGQISGDGATLAAAGGGTVALMHAGNSYATTTIDQARLEIGANGAAGTGAISFLPSADSVLQVDAGVALDNVIQNFDAGAMIDLPGIAFGPDTMLDLVPDPAGEKLTLSDGAHSQSVLLAGTHVAGGFHLQADGTGGTAITYAAPAALEGWSGG